MKSEHISQLKLHVERTLGRRILSSTDCRYLHNDISQQLQITVSFNTLRRFFQLMEAKHEPSIYTLNILSMYCGYSSFDDFATSLEIKPTENDCTNHKNADLLNYLVLLFKKTEVSGPNDHTYNHLVRETIIFLEHHPFLIDQFQREIARTKNGQDYYFEQFINIDNLNSFYGDGLRYYLHVKRTIESQLFGNYLLCFRFWLTMDKKNLEKHYAIVMGYEVDKKVQAAWAGFYFSPQLYYANALGLDPEEILIRARQYYATITPVKENHASLFVFQLVMSQALVLTGQYEEALFYIGEVFKNKKRYIASSVDVSFLEAVYLFKAISMAHLGEKTVAKELLEVINPTNFHFLSKQYLSILYLSLKQFLKKTAADQRQLQHLVETTGFVRLLA